MRKEWQPSIMGRCFTGSAKWNLSLDGHEIELAVDGNVYRALFDGESVLHINQGLVWADLILFGDQARRLRVDGLPNAQALALKAALDEVLADQALQRQAALLTDACQAVGDWLGRVAAMADQALQGRRWITHESQQEMLGSRPRIDLQAQWAQLRNPAIRQRLAGNAQQFELWLHQWPSDWVAAWNGLNEAHMERELVASRDLLDSVESQPLTPEQARAVICFDNRVQVVASAGSGKTSTMVAKAAYAIQRGFVAPEQIVLLAFNRQAAMELRQRVARSFARLGMGELAVEATTFHALGLAIIGQATGRKPDVPDWATDAAAGLRKLSAIVDQLNDGSPAFRSQWDLFRLVFARDLPAFGATSGVVDGWDRTGQGYLRTLNGERVRSQEELMIANWLFFNGVRYEYERCYEVDTATPGHRQYRPDFYYPDARLYHEHFALDAQGQAPSHFEGYLEGVDWKRQLHRDQGTDLVETTSHLLREGDWMDWLGQALAARGVVLDPNPDRPVAEDGQKPLEHAELVGLMRTFISHAKSNCLGMDALRQRLADLPKGSYAARHAMFLALVEPVMQAWDRALGQEGGIDFEDMLNLAAQHLEQGRYEAPYVLVMADEFQDASRARARLCRAMVDRPGRHLFAVGDDWQSINRFAGADVSVMTGFKDWFGHGQILKLEQTFRCPQALCDLSSGFVSRNPAQIGKQVRSVTAAIGPVLQAFQVDRREQLQGAMEQFLEDLCQQMRQGLVPAGRDGKVSVAILGRYRADEAFVPQRWRARWGACIELTFLTVHRSKGSEADYVILPAMVSRLRGNSFPNTRADDPVLALAMPCDDRFPLGEERRLFYVALTRARRGVAMFTVQGQQSLFLRELADAQAVVVARADGRQVREQPCPVCGQGVIIARSGRYGAFQSCSNYPVCEHKPAMAQAPAPAVRRQRPMPTSVPAAAAPAAFGAGVPRQVSAGMKSALAARAAELRGVHTGILPVGAPLQQAGYQRRLAALQAWRAEVAQARELPAYVIFHDATLAAIAERAPRSPQDLRGVSGMGARKLEAFGADLVRVCARQG